MNSDRQQQPLTTYTKRVGMWENIFFPARWMNFVLYFAFEELRRQYQRTILGPLWIVLTQFITIFAIGFVFSNVFNVPYKEFFPYISSSLISWNLLSSVLTIAPTVLVNNALSLKSFSIPSSIYSAQNLLRNFIQFLHAILIHAIVIVLFNVPINLYTLFFPLSLLLTVLWAYPFTIFLSLLGARFRDIIPMMSSVMYLFFLITPVLWKPDLISLEKSFIISYNPIFYLLDILRQPLLGEPMHPNTIGAITGIILIGWGVALLTARWARRNAVFWV